MTACSSAPAPAPSAFRRPRAPRPLQAQERDPMRGASGQPRLSAPSCASQAPPSRRASQSAAGRSVCLLLAMLVPFSPAPRVATSQRHPAVEVPGDQAHALGHVLFDGLLADAQTRGHFLLRQFVDPPQPHHLAATRRQAVEGVGQPRASGGRRTSAPATPPPSRRSATRNHPSSRSTRPGCGGRGRPSGAERWRTGTTWAGSAAPCRPLRRRARRSPGAGRDLVALRPAPPQVYVSACSCTRISSTNQASSASFIAGH